MDSIEHFVARRIYYVDLHVFLMPAFHAIHFSHCRAELCHNLSMARTTMKYIYIYMWIALRNYAEDQVSNVTMGQLFYVLSHVQKLSVAPRVVRGFGLWTCMRGANS